MSVVYHNPESSLERAQRKVLALSLLGLAIFLAAQALMVRSYIHNQKRPPSWDQAVHMEIALDYREAYHSGRWSEVMHLAPKPGMPPFPPLYHLALMHAYDSNNPAGAALWLNWFYLVVFCLSLFFICFAFRPDWAALGAVIAVAASPAIQDLLTTQLVDLSVTAWVAAAYLALLASDDFKKWLPSLLFGVLFAVGMLHKWSFFSYMIPAYIAGLMALNNRKSLWKVLAAGSVAVACCWPWYYAHLAVLAPRLVQASSDFAIPVTQGAAFLVYFMISADALGPFLWALGWASLAAPNYRARKEKSWLVWSWVLTSYVFWAIVPNRQIRFLVPGLSGLAASMCGAFPTEWIWAVAIFQIFGAVNFSAGWIAPISLPLPLHDITFLLSNPPGDENWHIDDILRQAQAKSDPSRSLANMTLVANAQYFNGANFTWMDRVLNLPSIHMRGVNKRLGDFSEFILLKDDKLGPEGVIEGLPAAAKAIADPAGWVARSYEKAGQWPLPDGSNAVLYQQKRLLGAPFSSPGTQFMFYDSGAFTANDLRIKLGAWDKAAADYPLVRLSAASVELRGVKVAHPAVELENVVLVPASYDKKVPEWDDVRFLRLGRLHLISGEVAGEDLKAVLQDRVKGLRIDKLTLERTISASGQIGHFPFSLEASVELLDSPRRVTVTVLKARIGATSLPAGLMSGYRQFTLSFEPTPDLPFAIDLPGLTIHDGKIAIP